MGVESIDRDLIRYAQCWEDADTVVSHMQVQPKQTILSIASAGDNTLSLLTKSPASVIAVDLSTAQLALLELKAQCFKSLTHAETLYFLGASEVQGQLKARISTYADLRKHLSDRARDFFDQRPEQITRGIISQGKMERYFLIFRKYVLPLVKDKATIAQLLTPKTRAERADFYHRRWGTPCYQVLIQLFFSQFLMGLLGREKCFFNHARENLSRFLLQASKTALIEQEPGHNPYLCWLLTGSYGPVLPHYLRLENFETIKSNVGRLVLKQGNLHQVIGDLPAKSIDSFNLSDVFEYLDQEQSLTLAKLIVRAAKANGRMVYWNMLVDRLTAEYYPEGLEVEEEYSTSLPAQTKTFFYKRLLVERLCKQ